MELYARVRRAVLVEGMSRRTARCCTISPLATWCARILPAIDERFRCWLVRGQAQDSRS